MNKKRFDLSNHKTDQDVDLNMAAAAIMFAVIAADDDVDHLELAHLIDLLRSRRGLSDDEIVDIMGAARRAIDNEHEIDSFLLILRQNMNKKDRTQLLDDLWDLALTDQAIHINEQSTIDQFAKALGLDRESVTKTQDMAEQKLEINLR